LHGCAIFVQATHNRWPDMNIPGSFCTSVLKTSDPVRAARFYSSLLGWNAKPATPEHTFLQSGGKTVASIQSIPSGHDAWIPHVRVDALDGTIDTATALGATLLDVTTVAGVARMATSVDDCDATMSRAPALGGDTGFVHTVPKHGRIGSIVDPGGAFLALRGPVPAA
jgi:predicted enzyme related to lactoylglutathione lyase